MPLQDANPTPSFGGFGFSRMWFLSHHRPYPKSKRSPRDAGDPTAVGPGWLEPGGIEAEQLGQNDRCFKNDGCNVVHADAFFATSEGSSADGVPTTTC